MDKKYAEYISKSNKLKIPWLNECFQCNNENKDFILSHGITALPRNILLDSTFKIINYDMGEYDIKRLFK